MYRLEIRIYERSDHLRAYAELYESEREDAQPVMTAHTDTDAPTPLAWAGHPKILESIREVCTELAQNQNELPI